jgi:hypothetical protein
MGQPVAAADFTTTLGDRLSRVNIVRRLRDPIGLKSGRDEMSLYLVSAIGRRIEARFSRQASANGADAHGGGAQRDAGG